MFGAAFAGSSYADRELTMAYCAAEFNRDDWLLVDIGIDVGINLASTLPLTSTSTTTDCRLLCMMPDDHARSCMIVSQSCKDLA